MNSTNSQQQPPTLPSIKDELKRKTIDMPKLEPKRKYSSALKQNPHKRVWLIVVVGCLIFLFELITFIIKANQLSKLEDSNDMSVTNLNKLGEKQDELKERNQWLIKDIEERKLALLKVQSGIYYMITSINNTRKQIKAKLDEITEQRNKLAQLLDNNRLIKANQNPASPQTLEKGNEDKALKVSGLKSLATYLRNEKEKHAKGIELNPTYKELGIDSLIVRQYDLLYLLDYWIAGRKMDYVLLYRGSEHQFAYESFHHLCDFKKSTLVLLKAQMGIIGGYTMATWEGYGPQRDAAAFLFNLSKERKYAISPNEIDNAIFNNPNSFPMFGKGDLKIAMKHITSHFPNVYGVQWSSFDMTNGYDLLNYSELEVFQVLSNIRDA